MKSDSKESSNAISHLTNLLSTSVTPTSISPKLICMACRTISSKTTKEIFVFKDEWNTTDGRVKQLQYPMKPGAKVRAHYQPDTSQWFEVVSGELTVTVDRITQVLKNGDRLETKPGAEHAQRNNSKKDVVVLEGHNPPLNIEPFFTELPSILESKNPVTICQFFTKYKSVVSSKSMSFNYLVPLIAKLRSRKGSSN